MLDNINKLIAKKIKNANHLMIIWENVAYSLVIIALYILCFGFSFLNLIDIGPLIALTILILVGQVIKIKLFKKDVNCKKIKYISCIHFSLLYFMLVRSSF